MLSLFFTCCIILFSLLLLVPTRHGKGGPVELKRQEKLKASLAGIMAASRWRDFLATSFNPATLKAVGRSQESSDIVAVAGQKKRCSADWRIEGIRGGTKEHMVFDWGFGNCVYANKSCGVQLRLSKRTFKLESVIEILDTPQERQGRIGAMRVRMGMLRLLAVVWYAPPRSTQSELYKRTCGAMVKWLDGTARKHAHNHLPRDGRLKCRLWPAAS